MTSEEKMQLLLLWDVHSENLNHQWGRFTLITGALSDSQLGTAVWQTQDHYTSAIARLLDCDRSHLSWYCFENQFGKCGMECEIDGETRQIRTLADLAWMIGLDQDNEGNRDE